MYTPRLYHLVYLQDNLGASSQFIGFNGTVASVAAVVIMPFAKWIIETVGHVHVCYICIILDSGKLAITTIIRSFKIISLHFWLLNELENEPNLNFFIFIRQSPPTYLYGFSILDGISQGLYWTSAIKYSFKIAPPSLIGTMAALTGSVNWIIGKIKQRKTKKQSWYVECRSWFRRGK